jgi:hypothetical protein
LIYRAVDTSGDAVGMKDAGIMVAERSTPMRVGAGFCASLGLALIAGCLAPATVRETVVVPHVVPTSAVGTVSQRTASPEYTGHDPMHQVQQTYEPYKPPIPGVSDAGTGTQGGSGTDASSYVSLCSDCNADYGPKGPSVLHFSGQNLYAGPFTLPKAPVVMRISLLTKDPTTTTLVYLDSGDGSQSQKNLLVEAKGGFTTTFKYKEHAGLYAFYLQINPLSPWTIDVYGPSPSPSPASAGSPGPSASPSASTSPSPSPSLLPSPKPSHSPLASAVPASPDPLGP